MQHSKPQMLSRRTFLQRSGAALSAAVAATRAVLGAGDRLEVGMIGVGRRGLQLLHHLKSRSDIRLVAGADLWSHHFTTAREMGYRFSGTPMYGKVIRRHLDVLLVAVPDHLQNRMLHRVLDSNEHVYLESPATFRLDEWDGLVEAAETAERVVSVGCQYQSHPANAQVRRWIEEGRLGEIRFVEARVNGGPTGVGAIPPDSSLEERKWSWFHEQPQKREYNPELFFQWGNYWEFSGGPALQAFQRPLAVFYSLLDLGRPDRVSALGSGVSEGKVRVPKLMSTLLEYAEGPTVSMSASARAPAAEPWLILVGTEGRVEYGRRSVRFVVAPESQQVARLIDSWPREIQQQYRNQLAAEVPRTEDGTVESEILFEGDGTAQHLERFFRAVHSGQPTHNLKFTRQIEEVGHLINKAYRSGRAEGNQSAF